MNEENTATTNKEKPKSENMFVSLVINIIIPSIILMKFSGDEYLGVVNGLLVALSFPLFYGLWDLVRCRRFNWISLLGLISILLTGGIGLLQLDPQWLAIKEASIPLIIGLVVLASTYTRYPLVRVMIYNDKIINLPKVDAALQQYQTHAAFEKRLMQASYMLAGSFFLSATLNYILARWIVVSPPGTTAFNEELGKMTALSYPVIVLPSMIVLMLTIWFIISGVKKLTHLELEEIFHGGENA
jgi:intracellular septation protein A